MKRLVAAIANGENDVVTGHGFAIESLNVLEDGLEGHSP